VTSNLGNLIAIVVSKESRRFGQVARVTKAGKKRYRLEFGDRERGVYSAEDLEVYQRYCTCSHPVASDNGLEQARCEHSERGIAAVRDRYCEINELPRSGISSEFCREYSKLFFRTRSLNKV